MANNKEENMPTQKVNQKIKVMALFENGMLVPKVFKWSNKNHKVKNVSLGYQEREGSSINYYFSVETDSGGVFKLRYNDQKLIWWLEDYWVE